MSVVMKKLTVAEFLDLEFPDEELNHHELHDGEVVVVPRPNPSQTKLQTALTGILGLFHLRSPEFRPLVSPSLALGMHYLCRPDLIVLLDAAHGGRCSEEELCFAGPPEVVVEVLSRPWTDLVTKRELYAAVGIPEYWILSPEDAAVAFLRRTGRLYKQEALLHQGIYETPILPGFRLDVSALLRDDAAALVRALNA